MSNETNEQHNTCRSCDGELATASESANGICVPCFCAQQDALAGSTAIDPLRSDAGTHSNTRAVLPGAVSGHAAIIPPQTLDAMLKVKREVKRRNLTRDQWEDRARQAELRVGQMEAENGRLALEVDAMAGRYHRLSGLVAMACGVCAAAGLAVGVAIGYLFFAP